MGSSRGRGAASAHAAVQAYWSVVLAELDKSLGRGAVEVDESAGMRVQRKMWTIERVFRRLPLLPTSRLRPEENGVGAMDN
jgi:hypothetical protein